MDRVGVFAPETADQVRERYDSLGPTAKAVVREIARAMEFDGDEYDQRVTPAVIERAQDVLFASLLEVHVGTREEFDAWQAETDLAVTEVGSEHVENVVWHAAGVADTAVAATYQNEQEAAVETLRRQAFGRIYREMLGEER